MVRFAAPALASLAVVVSLLSPPLVPQAEAAETAAAACTVPSDVTRLDKRLTQTANKIARGEPLVIVALGSSSTAGAGATSPDLSYPSRLQAVLQTVLRTPVTVINRGVNGEDAREMLARLDRDVRDMKPDLVIWQFGTNALLNESGVTNTARLADEGIARLQALGVDVLLLDPQYAPRVLADPDAGAMVDLFQVAGQKHQVPVFRRFSAMRHWHEARKIAFASFLSSDAFHMNDWSYGCLAEFLGGAILQAAAPRVADAGADLIELFALPI